MIPDENRPAIYAPFLCRACIFHVLYCRHDVCTTGGGGGTPDFRVPIYLYV